MNNCNHNDAETLGLDDDGFYIHWCPTCGARSNGWINGTTKTEWKLPVMYTEDKNAS